MFKKMILINMMMIALAFSQGHYTKQNDAARLAPRLLNYQGYLTDDQGIPITNPSLSMTFAIFDAVSSGNQKWTETQSSVDVNKGVFSVLLGSVTPIPDSVFNNTDRWLELTIGGQTLLPRTRIVSAAYAYTSTYSDTALYALNAGADNDWSYLISDGADTTIQMGGRWGLARLGNTMYGNADSTHMNLGVGGTTGESGQNYKYCTVGGGISNIARREGTTIGGGRENLASGGHATVGGGQNNTASGDCATVAGGVGNVASSGRAAIGGGFGNTASTGDAVVSGGLWNTASGYTATVGGGESNMASGWMSMVGGGHFNKARGQFSVVSGGGSNSEADSNSAIGDYSTVGGGIRNRTNNTYTTVSGGFNNTASGYVGTISGGSTNSASGSIATVAGGSENSATGECAAIGGGSLNIAGGTNATVGGGKFCKARGFYSVVAGGGGALDVDSNSAMGNGSVISGGYANIASGGGSVIGGGYGNENAGNFAVIPGGYADTIATGAHYSYLFGIGSKLTQDSTFMVDLPHIRFGTEAAGYEFPTADGSSGQTLITNGSGQVSWGAPIDGDWVISGSDMYSGVSGTVGVGISSPSSKLDIEGESGYSQFRMRKTYTPSGTSDPNGNTGDIAWDDIYLYIKTSAGWKRAVLATW